MLIGPQNFRLVVGENLIVPTSDKGIDYDACSITTHAPEDADFNSGVITVKKSNINTHGSFVDINVTPVTITAPGVKELALADWGKVAFLKLECTTAGTAPREIQVSICFRKLGFSLT